MSDLRKVLNALGYEGDPNSDSFKCHCPAHEDNTESLSVTRGKNDRILIKCHAGCDTKKVLEAAGLSWADVQPGQQSERSIKTTTKQRLGEIIATYDYTDASGNVIFQVTRHEPKAFRQRKPNGKGGWVWSLKGVKRELYQLPKLLATPANQWVFVVEGEKDADNLNAIGLMATCNAQGAGKWQPNYTETLSGRKICILPDNDEPGHEHAQAVAMALQGKAQTVRIVELPGLPDKGDVSDWLDADGTADQLLALVEATPDFIAPISAQPTIYTNGHSVADPLLAADLHDHGNARLVKELHPNRFSFTPGLGWMHYTGTHWDTENAEFKVNNAITDTLIKRRKAAVEAQREDVVKATAPTESRKNAIKGMFRDLVVESINEFDNDPHVLNCINGVIDLRTGQLVAHGASNRFTYCVRTPYAPNAISDAWLNFLSSSVDSYSEIAEFLQMAVGYSLTGDTREECLFYIQGPSRSGKGTAMQTLLTLLGQPLAWGVDFATFTKRRDGDSQNFDLAPLRPARMISASESGRYSSLNEAVVKSITGNDPVTAAFKHKDMFMYTPKFKIWLSSNHPAKGDVDDDAFWGRLRVIHFPNSHLGNEDKSLKWRMCSAENLPGVLAWAVQGAQQWYRSEQGLEIPFAIHQATQQHRAELDHVQQWLEECTAPEADNAVTVPNLYASYENWCEENGHTPKKAVAFGRALTAKGFEACRKRVGSQTLRAYRGLILRDTTGEGAA